MSRKRGFWDLFGRDLWKFADLEIGKQFKVRRTQMIRPLSIPKDSFYFLLPKASKIVRWIQKENGATLDSVIQYGQGTGAL